MSDISITKKVFGQTNDGLVELIEINFDDGIQIDLLTFGGIIKRLEVPNRHGERLDIVLSLPTLEEYVNDTSSIGCLVGRFANRIQNSEFQIDDEKFRITQNHGKHHIHGGNKGFGKVIWNIDSIDEKEDVVIVTLSYLSKDGEEGYPGNLRVVVSYVIKKDEITIQYKATTDRKTVFNPTNHSYFNLDGDFNTVIDDHFLKLNSASIVDVDDELIPTGEVLGIENTEFDFRDGNYIGNQSYDVCYKLDGTGELSSRNSGITMLMETSAPGVQLYTADHLHLDGLLSRSGICLETQLFPDAPNHSNFPSAVVHPGKEFKSETLYKFSAK